MHRKEDLAESVGREDTLWSSFYRLKHVLEQPTEDGNSNGSGTNQSSESSNSHTASGRSNRNGGCRVHHDIRYDDSKRIVDMSEIMPNLFIGDE